MQDGLTGFHVPADDPEELAGRIHLMLRMTSYGADVLCGTQLRTGYTAAHCRPDRQIYRASICDAGAVSVRPAPEYA